MYRGLVIVARLIVFWLSDRLSVGTLIPLLSVAIPGEWHGSMQKLLEPILAPFHSHPFNKSLFLAFVGLIGLKILFLVLLMHIYGNMVS